jgi:diguanylate cyclase (GGDEF)-like protein/PAS domain S-box-containing protein
MAVLPETVALPLQLAVLFLLALAVGAPWLHLRRSRQRADFERISRDEERYRALFEFTTDGVICHSADGRVVSANPAAEAILGLPLLQMQSLAPWGVWRQMNDASGAALAEAQMPVVRALQQGQHVKDTIVATTHWQSAAAVWLQLESIPLWRPGETRPQQVIAVFMDITENRRTEDRFRVIVDSSPNALLMLDQQGVIALANAASQRILGYSQEELIGHNVDLLEPQVYHPHDGHRQAHRLQTSGELAFGTLGDVTVRHKNGSPVPVDLGLSPISTAEGRFTLATVVDMTARRQAEQAMSQLAYYDVLTGLPNRRLFIERLQHAVSIRARHPRFGALLFLDVDNFKSINDSIGHEAGDLMLQQIATRLQQCLRESDSVARIGGDEFVVLLEELAEARQAAIVCAQDVASKIQVVLSQPYVLGGRAYPGSVSIGVTLWGADQTEDVGELLKRSDMAMYDAKRGGRNAVRFFDPRMQEELQQRMRMEADLHAAIAQQQFLLHYQRRVGADGGLLGAEALVRWLHPVRGLVSPQDFIPIAEETGLIVPIGRWVLQTACRQLQHWSLQEETRDLYLSVNISAAEIKRDSFVQEVQQMLVETGANPALLELEITESVLFENTQVLIAKMQALRALGLRFALDDFGTGYSSLSYLKVLPLSTLKIDQSFVRDIDKSHSDETIAQTIIRMGQTLGLVVIAEGVETEAQRAVLAQHGCENFQGYLFGRPVPIAVFEETMQAAAH